MVNEGLKIVQMEPLDQLLISAVAEESLGENKVLWDTFPQYSPLYNAEKELLFVLLLEYSDVFCFHPAVADRWARAHPQQFTNARIQGSPFS